MNNLARVQELILYPGVWNEDLIRGIFIPSDAEAILSIPLSYSSPPDLTEFIAGRTAGQELAKI
ncbi:hypothetical protein [Acidovorax sp. BLS4]|uniref:hypothetical protein n=1 Tax=Acidovorax sp. BLS4 TaxID=3273430 RepID=UPI0029421945|nr:hypothetical protein [Paracidovorax avenae]WOI45619.1 hypothetical protein R1Z03_24805 [Paracidovorax avenae]